MKEFSRLLMDDLPLDDNILIAFSLLLISVRKKKEREKASERLVMVEEIKETQLMHCKTSQSIGVRLLNIDTHGSKVLNALLSEF